MCFLLKEAVDLYLVSLAHQWRGCIQLLLLKGDLLAWPAEPKGLIWVQCNANWSLSWSEALWKAPCCLLIQVQTVSLAAVGALRVLTAACVVPAGKIHTPMEYKGELASYDMRLR